MKTNTGIQGFFPASYLHIREGMSCVRGEGEREGEREGGGEGGREREGENRERRVSVGERLGLIRA